MTGTVESPAHESPDDRPVVLIVEDEFLLRWPASEYLRESGYRVIEAASVDEAIIAFSSPTGVDLVFSDINLKGALDGHALSRWAAMNHPKVPMLLTSGDKNAAEGILTGPTRWFIPKPYVLADVHARIRHILSHGA